MRTISWLLLMAFSGPALADCMARSGEQTVPLLELYTSEGCSSCPPADKWLGGIADAGFGANKVVPLAFHVDYWDYIGWKDRFAKAEYSARQRKAASSGFSNFVYTPQVLFNGADFRGWHKNARFSDAINGSLNKPARANLELHLTKLDSGEIAVRTAAEASQPQDGKNADMFIAVFENKLISTINAGENSGRKLQHDYVVRELFGPYKLDSTTLQRDLKLKPEWQGRDAGVAMFVQNRTNGEVLQALALPFCT